MTIFYSPSKVAFYDTDIVSVVAPDDAVPTTPELRAAMIAALGRGCSINIDPDGNLYAVEPPASVVLARERAAAQVRIAAACANALTSGFKSSATGREMFYPSSDADQRNLQASANVALSAPSTWSTGLWCEGDTWAFVAHNAEEVGIVLRDWVAFRDAQQQHYAALLTQIATVDDPEALAALTW